MRERLVFVKLRITLAVFYILLLPAILELSLPTQWVVVAEVLQPRLSETQLWFIIRIALTQ
jgi:hypothetical protein